MDKLKIILGIWAVLLLILGYFISTIKSKIISRTISWALAIGTTILSILLTSEEPSITRMTIIASLQLLSMKVIVINETYIGKTKLTFLQWIAFAQGWFGMRPTLFETLFSKRLPNILPLAIKGTTRIVAGILLLFLSNQIKSDTIFLNYIAQLFQLIGLSFILHFGILNLSTCLWRSFGVDVKELFKSPYKSTSLTEFWGQRWNLAFSEMTALIVYKPLKISTNKSIAMIASFLVSGVLHEIAISFPVNAGYGLPLLYFCLHAIAMYLESNSTLIKRILKHSIAGHAWVMGWLILPMPLLFHTVFIIEVAKPLTKSILQAVSF